MVSEPTTPPFVLGGLGRTVASRGHVARLRHTVGAPGATVVPGAVDALTARSIERAGFDACYVTGAGVANAEFGFPDVELVTLTEMTEKVRRICEAVDIPVIVDGDTGHGGTMSVMRTVHSFEAAGAAGIQIEDQKSPKRCGHFDGKQIVPIDEMVTRIRAAVTARSDSSLMIIARTDARAIEGFDAAVDRCRVYASAGADALFLEAPQSVDELERIPRELGDDLPLVVNVVEGGKTPQLPVADLEAMGYRMVLHANMALRVATAAVQRALAHLAARGDTSDLLSDMVPWADRQELVHLTDVDDLEDALRGASADIVQAALR